VRPVPPHYRTVYTFTGLQTSTLHCNSEYQIKSRLGTGFSRVCLYRGMCLDSETLWSGTPVVKRTRQPPPM
jgi:hypothetical protein